MGTQVPFVRLPSAPLGPTTPSGTEAELGQSDGEVLVSGKTFTVDTHLFRELGELLVGRDSMALMELIKNSYDADATLVTVTGTDIRNPRTGRIVVQDNGVGMTPEIFEKGFLTIASRHKDKGERRSSRFKRRFTGEKGVGRLATHKLANVVEISSIPNPIYVKKATHGVKARIDWREIAKVETLSDLAQSGAIQVESIEIGDQQPGTSISLSHLKARWTDASLKRFYSELDGLLPPEDIIDLSKDLFASTFLRNTIPYLRDIKAGTKGSFTCLLQGDLQTGESYRSELASNAAWVLEIDATGQDSSVDFHIAPRIDSGQYNDPSECVADYTIPFPEHKDRPRFYARILIRQNSLWKKENAGVRMFMEGFRVLPYGEPTDDWLGVDSDYAERSRQIKSLEGIDFGEEEASDPNFGLVFLRNRSYRGAVFLTRSSAPTMRMLVNREGFIPNDSFHAVRDMVRVGIGLSVRVRAAAGSPRREERRELRRIQLAGVPNAPPAELREMVADTVSKALSLAKEAKSAAEKGDTSSAASHLIKASQLYSRASGLADALVTEPQMTRVLAGLGTHVSSLLHEVKGLISVARSIELALKSVRRTDGMSRTLAQKLAGLERQVSDMRFQVERQAAFLADLTSPDARRRRSKQSLADRFNSVLSWIQPQAEERGIIIENAVAADAVTTPMFPAEINIVLANVLSNAVKAAGKDGRIKLATDRVDGATIVTVQNTGKAVSLKNSERWFRPFQSTSHKADVQFGQGMGMGLTIVRDIVIENRGSVQFVKPQPPFSTALEIRFPG